MKKLLWCAALALAVLAYSPCAGGQDEITAEDMEHWRLAAEQGDADSQFQLGVAYEEGDVVDVNLDLAARWYIKAAEQGHPDAQNNLGYAYLHGLGVGRDNDEAMRWFREAAKQNSSDAMVNIGFMYQFGNGVPENRIEAGRWYRKAADLGNSVAQFNIGTMYAAGEGVDQDDGEALEWYKAAAEQNNNEAMTAIGEAYQEGRGVEQNFDEAMSWYRKAADLGDAEAHNAIGAMYLHGQGVEQDYEEAMQWLQQAVEHGSSEACFNIGEVYENGLGVEKDPREALKWYREAADRDFEPADEKVRELGRALAEGNVDTADAATNIDAEQPGEGIAATGLEGTDEESDVNHERYRQWMRERYVPKYESATLNAWLEEIDFPYDMPVDDQKEKCAALLEAGNLFASVKLENLLYMSGGSGVIEATEELRIKNTNSGAVALLEHASNAGNPVATGLLAGVYMCGLQPWTLGSREEMSKGVELFAEATRQKNGGKLTPERMAKWLEQLDAPKEISPSADAMVERCRKQYESGNIFAGTQLARAYRMSTGPTDETRFWENVCFVDQAQVFLLEMANLDNARALDLMAELYKHGMAYEPLNKEAQKRLAREFIARAEKVRPYPMPEVDPTTLKFWMNDIRRFRGMDELVNNLSTLQNMYVSGNLVAGLYIESVMDKLMTPLEAEWNDRNRQNMTVALLKKLADEGDEVAKGQLRFVRVSGLGGEVEEE